MSNRGTIRSIFLLAVSALLALECKHPTDPYPRNPRAYKWETAQINFPIAGATEMRSVWGSGFKDVYIVGHSSYGNPGMMFHFDGDRWSPVNTPFGNIDLSSIFGFASNDIYAVGHKYYPSASSPGGYADSALLIHFNGAEWKEVLQWKMGVSGLVSIWGTSPTDVYAGSYDGKILHYDGQAWSVQILSQPILVQAIGGNPTIVFATGNTLDSIQANANVCIYKNTGQGWSLVEEQPFYTNQNDPHFGWGSIYSASVNTIYSAHPGISWWVNGAWSRMAGSPLPIAKIGGFADDDIFATGYANVYHWNGSDWAQLNVFPNGAPEGITLIGIWTNGWDAFIVGYANGVSYVLHGK